MTVHHAMVELPDDPDTVLIVMHAHGRFMSVPINKQFLVAEDAREAIIAIIQRGELELQTDRKLYRGAPGERL